MTETNSDDQQFTLANLPLGVASRQGLDDPAGIATRFHDSVYFLDDLRRVGLLKGLPIEVESAIQKVKLPRFRYLGGPANLT